MSNPAWPSAPLGAIATDIRDGTHGTHPRGKEGIPLLSAKNVTSGGRVVWNGDDDCISEREYQIITALFSPRDEDLLVTVVGTLGRTALFGGDKVAFQRSVAFVRPNKEMVLPRYLLQASKDEAFVRQLQKRSNATAQAGLYLGELAKISIPVPSKLVQCRIAEVLSTLDNAIDQTEALIGKYHQVKAGLMHDLFSRGIDEDGKLRPLRSEAPDLYKQTSIGWLPKEWDVVSLGGVAEIVSGITLSPRQPPGRIVVVPYLRVANVQDGYLDLSEMKTIAIDEKTLTNLRLSPGDVLMNEGGDFDKLGRGAVWEGQIEDCIHQNHVFRVRCDQSKLGPYFLAFWSESEFGKKYFVLSSKQSTNLASINSTQLNAFLVAAPGRGEQTEIEERITAINRNIVANQQLLAKLRKQKAGLMNDLLTGKVPVRVEAPEAAHV